MRNFLILLIIIVLSVAFAKEIRAQQQYLAMHTIDSLQETAVLNYVSVGSGYSINSMIRFWGINSVISFEYGRQLSSMYGIEASMYYADAYKTNTDIFGNILTSLTGSLSATAKPFVDTPFRIGIGGAVRWYSSLEGNPGAIYLNLPQIYYVEAVQLGINAQLEYAFPLSNTIDIGIRGQGQVFFEPFFLRSNADAASVVPAPILQLVPQLNPKATSYVVNLGAFLRINF